MRKIEAPNDSVPECELGTQWHIYDGGKRGRQEKGRKRHINRERSSGERKLDTR